MKKYLFLLFFLIPFNSYALECDVIYSGSGSSSYNGTYVDTGTLFRGEPEFYKASSGTYLSVNSTSYDPALLYWMFSPTSAHDSNAYYRTYASTYIGSYTTAGAGTDPAGTVTEDCGGEPEPTSTSSPSTQATSTEALLTSISFGLTIIIVILSIFTIGYIWNNLTKRKPWL